MESFLKVSQKTCLKYNERYWIKFELELNKQFDSIAIIFLQEPKYVEGDGKIESAVIETYNFIIKKSNRYKSIYFVNLMPIEKEKISCKNRAKIRNAMYRNLSEIKKIVSMHDNENVDVIYGARQASSIKNVKSVIDLKILRTFFNVLKKDKRVFLKKLVDCKGNLAYVKKGSAIKRIDDVEQVSELNLE